MPAPIDPDTVVVPLPEMSVTFSATPSATPKMDVTERSPAPVPVSSTRSWPLATVTGPSVRSVFVVFTEPAALIGPAVAARPPANVMTSAVVVPSVVVPVFRNVVAFVTVNVAESMVTP